MTGTQGRWDFLSLSALAAAVGALVFGFALAASAQVQPIAPNLSTVPERSGAREYVDVLISFKAPPGIAEQAAVSHFGGAVKNRFTIVPAVSARVPSLAVEILRKHPLVKEVEMDGMFYAIDINNTWGVAHIGAGEVHANGTVGGGVKVAVVDSGIDHTHAELSANYAGGYDFVNNDSDPMDDNGHGTHVAGTVAAAWNGTGVVGASPSAALYGLKVLNSSGGGSFSNIIKALDWAAANGIQVANHSYGSGSDPGSIVKAAFDNSAAKGVLHVAAAGNSGNCRGNNNTVGYPARYASVIAVAATDKSDKRPCWSSTGPDVELAAPGVSINSTKLGGGYQLMSGTSMASPHVAGLAALVIAAGEKDIGAVRQILRDTVKDIGASGKDNHYGYGLVQAVPAVAAVAPAEGDPAPLPQYTLAVTLDGGSGTVVSSAAGINCGSDCTEEYDEGTEVVLTASAAEGSEFSGWSGACSGSGGCVLTMNANKNVTATFTAQQNKSASIVKVSNISYSESGSSRRFNPDLNITLTVVNADGSAVSGASVSILLKNTSTGQSWNGSGKTGSNGKLSLKLSRAPSGCYETEVKSLSASGLEWNGLTPDNGHCVSGVSARSVDGRSASSASVELEVK